MILLLLIISLALVPVYSFASGSAQLSHIGLAHTPEIRPRGLYHCNVLCSTALSKNKTEHIEEVDSDVRRYSPGARRVAFPTLQIPPPTGRHVKRDPRHTFLS